MRASNRWLLPIRARHIQRLQSIATDLAGGSKAATDLDEIAILAAPCRDAAGVTTKLKFVMSLVLAMEWLVSGCVYPPRPRVSG